MALKLHDFAFKLPLPLLHSAQNLPKTLSFAAKPRLHRVEGV